METNNNLLRGNIMRLIAVVLLIATFLFASFDHVQAQCPNNLLPHGYVFPTSNRKVFWLTGRDADAPRGLPLFRVFYRAGRHSRNIYYQNDGFATFPKGQSWVYIQDLDSCGYPIRWVFVRLMMSYEHD